MTSLLRLFSLLFLTAHLALYFPGLADPVFLLASCGAGFLLAWWWRGIRLPWAFALAVLAPLALKILLNFFLDQAVSGAPSSWDLVPVWLDRQLVFAALPYLLAWTATTLVVTFPRLVAWERLTNALVLAALFWAQGQYKVTLYPHPLFLALALGLYLAAEAAILFLNQNRNRPPLQGPRSSWGRTSRRVGLVTGTAVLVLVCLGFLWNLFRTFEDGSSQAKGGLLKHELMQFDFSKLIRLETEISMGDDLILLYREEGAPKQRYLRRFLMSGYSPDKGFYINPGPGREEENVPPVGRQKLTFSLPKNETRQTVQQEYYLVNLDPASLLALNEPREIQPYSKWDHSSFVGAYAAVSQVWDGQGEDLISITESGLPPDRLDYYTAFSGSPVIRKLAQEVTRSSLTYFEKVTAVLGYLKDNYYYSLKPGAAPDGDQLKYFLTESRKGYCSYFAFSMALMLRSIGIPSRVCVGFITDPQASMLNFYPVRSYLSHAWVEVPFQGLGWIEFDPTTDRTAPGEEFSQPKGMSPEELSKMISEILKNPPKLLNEAPPPPDLPQERWKTFLKNSLTALERSWPWVLLGLLLLFLLVWNLRYRLLLLVTPDPRKRTRLDWKSFQHELALGGIQPLPAETPSAYVRRAKALINAPGDTSSWTELAALAEEARYAPAYPVSRRKEARRRFRQPLPRIGNLWNQLFRRTLRFFLPFWTFPPRGGRR